MDMLFFFHQRLGHVGHVKDGTGEDSGGPFVPSDFLLFQESDQQKNTCESFDACGISIWLQLQGGPRADRYKWSDMGPL